MCNICIPPATKDEDKSLVSTNKTKQRYLWISIFLWLIDISFVGSCYQHLRID